MKTAKMAALAILGATALICDAATAAIPTSPPPASTAPTDIGAAQPESLGLKRDSSTRLTLPVMINGKGPFDFLVDTGSDRTVISRDLATALALPPGPAVIIHEGGGADPARTVVIDHLTIGKRTIDHIEAPALSETNLGAAGMLGVDALRDLHVIMDFKAMRLSSSPSRAEPLDEHTIVVQGRSRFGQLILANSRIHGVTVLVVLDSGSELSVGNPALLRLLTGRSTVPDPRQTTEILTVTGRRLDIELQVVPEAQVGGVTIRNLPIGFAQLHTFDRFGLTRQPALLLGMDVLSLCQKVTVDLRRREATFTMN